MNKSTDTNTNIPKSLTPEETAVKRSMELTKAREEEMSRLMAEGKIRMEALYEMDVEL